MLVWRSSTASRGEFGSAFAIDGELGGIMLKPISIGARPQFQRDNPLAERRGKVHSARTRVIAAVVYAIAR